MGEKHADLPTMPELTIPSGSAHTPTPEKLEFPQESCSQATAGARMIVDAARAFGPDLTILVTGPLTDIDTALTLDPRRCGRRASCSWAAPSRRKGIATTSSAKRT